MESTTNGSLLHQQDATLSALRRRRTKLIALFSAFLVFLALIIAALITYLIGYSDVEAFDRTATVDPSLLAFCSAVDSTPSCLESFEPIVYTNPVGNPGQLITLSLETAAGELTSLLSNSTGGCSDSIREALDRINGSFSFADQWQRDGMVGRIAAAAEDLKGCAAGGEVGEKVERCKLFLGYSRDFLSRYDDVWRVSDAARYSWDWLKSRCEENVFVFLAYGLQLLFLGFLLWSVLRIR